MSISIWEVLQFVLTAFEIGVCIWICDVVVYDGELVKKYRKYIIGWGGFVILIVAWNRELSFFSWPIFIFQIIGITSIAFAKNKRLWNIFCIFVLDYSLIISLLDMTISFIIANKLNDDFWHTVYYRNSYKSILIYFSSRTIGFTLCNIVKRCKKKYPFNIENYKGVLVSVGTIGCIWGWWLLVILEDYSDDNGILDSFFIITCLMILMALMAIELRNAYLKTQAQLASMKNELLQQNYSNLHSLYRSNQYIYHDFKNHMMILNNYLEQNKCEEASAYIRKIFHPVESLNNFIRSGCDILDLVLNVKEEEARQKGISYKVDIDIGIKFQINKNELGNIFFNLLDNAIEACEKIEHKDKWIHITIKKKNQIQLIKIENSIEKPIHMENGIYITNKNDKKRHGIGMKSVEASVNQYGGNIQWKSTDTVFTVVITFFENEL